MLWSENWLILSRPLLPLCSPLLPSLAFAESQLLSATVRMCAFAFDVCVCWTDDAAGSRAASPAKKASSEFSSLLSEGHISSSQYLTSESVQIKSPGHDQLCFAAHESV